MKYHILSPFSRVENKEAWIKHLRQFDVIIHPIINDPIEFPKEDWIKPFTFKAKPKTKWIYYYALNEFLDSETLIDDDYYIFVNDDDFLAPDFFEKIKGIDSDFIVVSMKRGHKASRHGGTSTLNATWRVMGKRHIGGEQIILKGKFLKSERFRRNITGDGRFIRSLWHKYPHENFTFVRDAYVWFNYLEPGRWNEKTISKHKNTK